MRISRLFSILIFLLTVGNAYAMDDLQVHDPWVRTAPPGSPMAGYFNLKNNGENAKHLVNADATGFGMTMIHQTVEEDGLMKMKHIDSIEVQSGSEIIFKPGSYHLMLMNPEKTLKPGEMVQVEFLFQDGSVKQTMFTVRDGSGNTEAGHSY